MTRVGPDVFDVVVVGAGSAGAVLAARLSERGDRSVLVLDEGPDHLPGSEPERVLDAASVPASTVPEPWVRWSEVRLGPARTALVPRGRAVGGSSAVNGTYFVRGTPADFDRWAQGGNPMWSYERVLPHFRRIESDLDFGGGEWHGADGPMPVRRPPQADLHPISAGFAAAALDAGFVDEPDKNAPGEPGVGPVPCNVVEGRRVSVASAWLDPIRDRPNLSVRGGARVRRVVIEGGRAVGVEVDAGRASRILRAAQVVLSAGAVGSAELLLRSGIGPASDLLEQGIDVVVDAPGVGRLQNHAAIDVYWQPVEGAGERAGVGKWRPGFEVALHVEDVELLVMTRPYGVASGDRPDDELLSLRVGVQRHASPGRVRLGSAAPHAPPELEHSVLSMPEDRARARRGVRLAVELLASAPLADLVGACHGPTAAELASDAALDAWLAEHAGLSMHAAGTAAMGPDDDPDAVVDERCRVYGVSGLWVVDTSIMPVLTSRGPAATAVMIGDRAAELVADP